MFAAYDTSLELIRELRTVVAVLRQHDRDLTNQLRRASTSISLNLAEGRERTGGDRRHFFEIARGSASEVRAALDTADAWGWPVTLGPSRAVLDRLGGLLYGLTHARHR
jgi:four helix bundle protein